MEAVNELTGGFLGDASTHVTAEENLPFGELGLIRETGEINSAEVVGEVKESIGELGRQGEEKSICSGDGFVKFAEGGERPVATDCSCQDEGEYFGCDVLDLDVGRSRLVEEVRN